MSNVMIINKGHIFQHASAYIISINFVMFHTILVWIVCMLDFSHNSFRFKTGIRIFYIMCSHSHLHCFILFRTGFNFICAKFVFVDWCSSSG